MTQDLFTNNASTTVPLAKTAVAALTQETWTVTSSVGFPVANSSAKPPSIFRFVDPAAPSETMACLNVSGTTWTVVRGYEGTTPVVHTAGFTVGHTLTAGWAGGLDSRYLPKVYNVKDQFGALADGTTNDAAAFQAAVDAAGTAGGGVVYIPAGTYKITTEIALPSSVPVKIMGAGKGLVTLTTGVSSGNMFSKTGTGTTVSGIELSGFTIDLTGTTSATGISLTYVKRALVQSVRVIGVQQWGVYVGVALGSDTVARNSFVTVRDCDFEQASGTYEGLLLLNSTDVLVDNCTFVLNGASANGIGLYQVTDRVTVSNCSFSGIGIAAYYNLSCNRTRFTGCRVTGPAGITGAGLSDNGAFGWGFCKGLMVDSCFFQSTVSDGLQIGAVQDANVINCAFYQCQSSGMVINNGRGGVNAANDSLAISNCTFTECNQSNVSNILNPGIFLNIYSSSNLRLCILGCSFVDNQGSPTMTYAITVYAASAFALNGPKFIGNAFAVTNGLTYSTATEGTVVKLGN